MRTLLVAAALTLTAAPVLCQGDAELRARDRRIKEHQGNKAYEQVIAEINVQVEAVAGTSWQDSLWTYIYPIGNAEWKVHGREAAAAASERLYERIAATGRSPQWEVKALIKLSGLYYDLSFMEQHERVARLALSTAERNTGRIPPLVLADANYCMGDAHTDLGRYDVALPLFQRAIDLGRAIDPLPRPRLATYYNGQGGALRKLGRNREAEAGYMQGIAIIEQDTSLAGLSRRATLLGNWAILLQGTGDLHRSKELNGQALEAMNEVIARTRDPQDRTTAKMNRTRILLNLASTYFDMSDYERSASCLHTAQAERRAIFGDAHPAVINMNDPIAEVEAMAGNYEKAEALLREQIDVVSVTHEGGSGKMLDLQGRLARMVRNQGDLARADSIYSLVLPKDVREIRGSTDRSLAVVLAERAQLRILQGRHADAISDLLLGRGIHGRVLGPRHERLAEADVVISAAALAIGDTLMARQFADSAMLLLAERIALVERPLAPTALRFPGLLAEAVMARIAVERATHPGSGREREWLRTLDIAFASLHRNMSSLSDEEARLQMAGSQRQLFDLGLDLAHAAHERFGEAADLDRFLRISESDRAILLKNRLNSFTSLRYANVPDSVLMREQGLLKALAVDPDDPKSWDGLYGKEEAYAAFLDTLQQRYPGYFSLRYGEPRVSIEDLRQQLVTDQRDLLAYAVTGEHLYMLVVSADTAALLRVPGHGLAAAVKALNEAVVARDIDRYLKAGHALYTLVFAPVAPLLRKPELLIIADGELQRVNFEALLSAPSTAADLRQHLLIQRYAIAYLLSATTAVQFDVLKKGRPSSALALAPGFSDDLKQEYIAQVSDSARIDRDFLGYVRQPFAMGTAEKLGDLLSARVMLGAQANEHDFRELAREYGILHLGTHAELNERSPMYSRLVLSKNGLDRGADADGYLHAYEIYEMDLRAQLAVLTACETGAGVNTEGEGVRSLGYSFAYAGCPSLVTSLWEIDEKISSEIITHFYEYLADGMPKHMALRQAKLDHLSKATDDLAMPYYWAGMVLVGDVAPITGVDDDWSAWLILAVLAFGLCMLVILWRFIRR